MDGGKERDDRAGARKLSEKNVIFTLLNLHLKTKLLL